MGLLRAEPLNHKNKIKRRVKMLNLVVVYIQVLVDDLYVTWDDDDGYISELATGKNISLIIKANSNILGFKVDKGKNIKQLQNFSQAGNKIYRQEIPVRRRGKNPYILDTENDTRLLRVNDFCFDIHEIAIVFRKGRGFLRTQRVYHDFCFKNGEKVYCPKFVKWPQLIDFLSRIYKKNGTFDKLPDISERYGLQNLLLRF